MSTSNQGRNEIRFNNSNGKCLLENWVEERAVMTIDPSPGLDETTKAGHKGILSTNFDAEPEKISTCQDSYKAPAQLGVRTMGKKKELLMQMIYDQASKEVHEEFNPPPEPTEFKSVTQKDFNIDDFVPQEAKYTRSHNLSEQPVTFWSDHKDCVTGVSQVKTHDSPFRKNAAFSTPISEYLGQTKPYNIENIPKM
ncbi:sperm-associated antigen 8-like [Tubulanus polymorphus]|uniref:sperm-associated antigen 8-like n=1 Tax=Tubulanus polymorphus TaxID=672921 RepID=UPI003DA2D98C